MFSSEAFNKVVHGGDFIDDRWEGIPCNSPNHLSTGQEHGLSHSLFQQFVALYLYNYPSRIKGQLNFKPTSSWRKTMLGDQLGSIECATVNKTLTAEGALPKFEVSATGGGQLCGAEVTSIATYMAQMRSDGSLYGECPNAGVVMAADGVATFRATGVGSFTEDGGSKFRGVAYFETAAPSLSSLNGMCVVYHWDVDASGVATWNLWEWT